MRLTASSKGAVIALTRAMAIELAPFGIRVNAISPGPVYTEMFTNNVTREEDRKRIAESAPLGRIGMPEDIARGILYLASSDSDWCTGAVAQYRWWFIYSQIRWGSRFQYK